MKQFTKALRKVIFKAVSMGFTVSNSKSLDPYFKGDLDGIHIWINDEDDDDEDLFNVLHLIGHSIQWNVSEKLRELGSVLHHNPSDELLKQLQEYEWEANCYALQLLHDCKIKGLDAWLNERYRMDMYYLTHFYKTGEKVNYITEIATQYAYVRPLVLREIPKFVPVALEGSRDGIVLSF